MRQESTGPRAARAAAVAFLLAVTALESASALRGWWLDDDPQLLLEAIRQPWWRALFDPGEYVHLAAHTFTPLLVLSFKLDYRLAGMQPSFFYLHQAIAMAAAVVLLFLVLERLGDRIAATAGAALLAVSWQSIYAVRTLMIRHYVEGLVAALAAVLVWMVWAGEVGSDGAPRSGRWELAGALLYLLALLSKEVYAPIPLVLLALGWRKAEAPARIGRRLLGPAAALALFLAWRWWMIGLFGVYQAAPSRDALIRFPLVLWDHVIGGAAGPVRVVWSVCALALLVVFAVRSRGRAVTLACAVGAAAVFPVLPLAANPEWRYGFAAAVLLIAFLAIAAAGSRPGVAVLLILAAVVAVTSVAQRRAYEASRRASAAEGKFVWAAPPAPFVLAATTPGWYLEGVADLRSIAGRGSAPRFVFSKYALLIGGIDPERLVVVTADGRRIMPLRDAPPGTPAASQFGSQPQRDLERARYRALEPLSVRFAMRGHDATWSLGPTPGNFVFLSDPEWTAIPLHPTGFQRVPAPRGEQWFRIVRVTPDGVWTSSPRFRVPAPGGQVVWSR
jgi:hypothetical protein